MSRYKILYPQRPHTNTTDDTRERVSERGLLDEDSALKGGRC